MKRFISLMLTLILVLGAAFSANAVAQDEEKPVPQLFPPELEARIILGELIASIGLYHSCTDDSANAMDEAIDNAHAALLDSDGNFNMDTTLAQLNEHIAAVQAAKDELVGRASFNVLLSSLLEYKKEYFTAASFAVLQAAIADALVTQKRTQYDALRNASWGMVRIADRTRLVEALAHANDVKNRGYTQASWDALQAAIIAAQAVMDDESATAEQVQEQVFALFFALDKLTLADRDGLFTLIEQARAIAKGNYAEDSWNALQTAIANAQTVADEMYVTEQQLIDQYTALQNAIDGLSTADKTALSALVFQAKAIAKGDYTDASWNALQAAIANAQAAADKANATQAQVNTQLSALQNAINGLATNPLPPPKTIFSTKYEATLLNWLLFFVGFGWIWMWFF